MIAFCQAGQLATPFGPLAYSTPLTAAPLAYSAPLTAAPLAYSAPLAYNGGFGYTSQYINQPVATAYASPYASPYASAYTAPLSARSLAYTSPLIQSAPLLNAAAYTLPAVGAPIVSSI